MSSDIHHYGDKCIKWNTLENVVIMGDNWSSLIDGNDKEYWTNITKSHIIPTLLNLHHIEGLTI